MIHNLQCERTFNIYHTTGLSLYLRFTDFSREYTIRLVAWNVLIRKKYCLPYHKWRLAEGSMPQLGSSMMMILLLPIILIKKLNFLLVPPEHCLVRLSKWSVIFKIFPQLNRCLIFIKQKKKTLWVFFKRVCYTYIEKLFWKLPTYFFPVFPLTLLNTWGNVRLSCNYRNSQEKALKMYLSINLLISFIGTPLMRL